MSSEQGASPVVSKDLSGKMHDSFRNEHHATFTLGDGATAREFPVKDLGYDDYIEFFKLAKPILTTFAQTMDLGAKDGQIQLDFDPMKLDIDTIINVAGNDLPKMAWICCRQSDPMITLAEVKKLGRRPWSMAHVVLTQVRHNNLVKEFSDFFPKLAKDIEALIPDAKAAMTPSTPTPASDIQT